MLLEAATERLEQDLDRQIMTATYRHAQYDWNPNDNTDGYFKLATMHYQLGETMF